jgi:hypothetical protein
MQGLLLNVLSLVCRRAAVATVQANSQRIIEKPLAEDTKAASCIARLHSSTVIEADLRGCSQQTDY